MRTVLHLSACALAALLPLLEPARPSPAHAFPGWPTEYEGRALRRVPLDPRELALLQRFPGEVACFSDGERRIVLRWIAEPTPDLHPAARCFRGRGYAIEPGGTVRDAQGRAWGRFLARRGPERLRVSECVVDGAGRSWSDVSHWFWRQVVARESGPWWAIVVVEAADGG